MKERLRKVFGCDVRSLAVFRFALALLLWQDIAHRFPLAEAFYSDAGFFPRDYAYDEYPFSYSLNYLSGSVFFQQFLFLALAVSALALAVGWMTRWATFCCWLLLISIHVRNPFALIGGDTLLRMLLFWSLFIPLGKVWSVDHWLSRRRQPEPDSRDLPGGTDQRQVSDRGNSNPTWLWATTGTACLILQVCIVYWCAGIAKLTEHWWDGTAMEYVLRLSLYVQPLGEWVLGQPLLLTAITYGTLVLELAGPFLLFIPFGTDRFRILTILLFWGLHLGIELTLNVGNFGMVSSVAWIPLIPGIVWDRLGCCRRRTAGSHVESQVESSSATAGGPAPISRPRTSRWGLAQVLKNTVPILFLVYIAVGNYAGLTILRDTPWQLHLPVDYYRPGWVTMVTQDFQMFGDPPAYDPTYVFAGRLSDGEEVDLIHDRPAAESRPDAQRANPVAESWRVLHRFMLRHPGNARFHQALLEYYTRVWNDRHPEERQVEESRLECYFEPLGPDYQAGSYIRRPDMARWSTPRDPAKASSEKSEEDLVDEIDSFFRGLDAAPIEMGR